MSHSFVLADIPELSPNVVRTFQRGGITHVVDLFVHSPQEIAKKCRVNLRVIDEVIDTASKAITTAPRYLSDVVSNEPTCFTTGDTSLDRMLGGGIKTGMVWEIVGEGASGKTQLALQLSLFAQAPISNRGLAGTVCYLTSYSGLPTPRLVEIFEGHPLLGLTGHNPLDYIVTLETKSTDILRTVLSTTFPALLAEKAKSRPVKLLVIDALADLFREDGRTTSVQLAERSRLLSEIAIQLHRLAAQHNLAVVVINHVVDVWEQSLSHDGQTELIYADQARFFGSGDSLTIETRKKAALGLVWANQINARIMLNRTGRRRIVDGYSISTSAKKRKVSGMHGSAQPRVQPGTQLQDTLIRRLSVIFSSICSPCSSDFIVTHRGVECLPEDTISTPQLPSNSNPSLDTPLIRESSSSQSSTQLGNIASLDVACANQSSHLLPVELPTEEPSLEEDEEELYWRNMEDVVDWDEAAVEAGPNA